jgi:HD-GYP domain-containing protein (c-di-GMP phosphodiesterase class II)
MRPYLQTLLGTKWWLVPAIVFAALSLAAPFAYLYYQQKHDQKRMRRQRAQLARLKEITATSIEISHEQLLKNIPPFLMQMYREDFQADINYAAIYLWDKSQALYRLISSKTKKADVSLETNILKTDPIPSWFMEKGPYFAKQNLLDLNYLEAFKYEDIEYYQSKQTNRGLIQAIEILKGSLKASKADVCVSCFYKDKLLAFLLMGKKERGSYTQEELDTFSLLAHDISSNIRGGELRDELEQSYIDAISSIIIALEERDAYTKGHSERVVKYSVVVAEELKDVFPFTRIINLVDKVRRAALLHDVGKIGVPDSILLKPGKLTDEEFENLKRHPHTSLSILKNIKSLSEDIRDGIESHHDKYDGTGYGKGVKGHMVPPVARIIAVADTFDAMTSNRPYRNALPESAAITEINKVSGHQFDPKVVDAFNKAYEKGALRKA